MNTAITSNGFQNIKFAIQDVYLVSETICGCKAWLRSVVSEELFTSNIDDMGRNIDGVRVRMIRLIFTLALLVVIPSAAARNASPASGMFRTSYNRIHELSCWLQPRGVFQL